MFYLDVTAITSISASIPGRAGWLEENQSAGGHPFVAQACHRERGIETVANQFAVGSSDAVGFAADEDMRSGLDSTQCSPRREILFHPRARDPHGLSPFGKLGS